MTHAYQIAVMIAAATGQYCGFQECRASAAVQPVGFSAGLCAAEDRVNARHGSADADDGSVVVSVQEFIAELFPDK